MLVSNHRNYTKGTGLDRVKILLGNGLMTSEGDFWKRQRYMMQPLFHRRVVTGFNQLIDAANSRFIDKVGRAGRPRRARQPHRRHERADAGDRPGIHLRQGSGHPHAAAGWQSVCDRD